jgi:hypothetical protein
MGLFDALSDLTSAVVKTALTPIAVVKDAVDVVSGKEPENTKELLKSAADDVEEAGKDLTE